MLYECPFGVGNWKKYVNNNSSNSRAFLLFFLSTVFVVIHFDRDYVGVGTFEFDKSISL